MCLGKIIRRQANNEFIDKIKKILNIIQKNICYFLMFLVYS
ncbi:hypothetical protein DSUL_20566 [Desulfovibrionales bacterium]